MIENRQFFFSKFFVYNKSVEQTRVELRFRSNLPFNSGPSFSIMMKGDHSITINVVSNEDRGSSSSQAGGTVELLPRLMLLPSFSYSFSLSLSLPSSIPLRKLISQTRLEFEKIQTYLSPLTHDRRFNHPRRLTISQQR